LERFLLNAVCKMTAETRSNEDLLPFDAYQCICLAFLHARPDQGEAKSRGAAWFPASVNAQRLSRFAFQYLRDFKARAFPGPDYWHLSITCLCDVAVQPRLGITLE
jgi:hypothetical protein